MWWIVASAALNVSPVYLSCNLDVTDYPFAAEIVINEADQSAMISLPATGRVARRTAVFSPSEVKILDDEATWLIDRVNLGIKRVLILGEKRWDERGSCRVTPAPAKRAF